MKKFLVGLLTVALAASMLVGCGKKEEKKKADNAGCCNTLFHMRLLVFS